MTKVWTVTDARAQLSELLRRARTEGPQRIGRQLEKQCVLVSAREWEEATNKPAHFGRWLVENAPREQEGDPPVDFENRHDLPDRPPPFDEYVK